MKGILKSKFVSALIVFVISITVLGSATYAWFTNIINNDVESMNFYVSASDAMMLSALSSPELNSVSDWTVQLMKSEITSANRGNQTGAFPEDMNVVSSLFNNEASGFYTASYSTSGVLNGFININQANNFAKFSLWTKTTRNGFIYLDVGSYINALTLTEPNNAIANSIRVGFVPVNYDENGNAPDGTIPNEAWQYAVIWEPNSTAHLSAIYGGPGGTDKLITNAVKNSVAVANPVNTAGLQDAISQQNTFDFTTGGTNVSGANFYNSQGQPVVISSDEKIALFNMNADTMQRFNVYIWAEGSDQDAVDAVAKSFFRTYIKFGQEYDKFLGNEFIPKN
jgi:hypothetical protein